MQKGALAIEHFRHESAQWLRADQNQPEKDRDLQNPNAGHNALLRIFPDGEARKSGK
jgi:hypothetical protein